MLRSKTLMIAFGVFALSACSKGDDAAKDPATKPQESQPAKAGDQPAKASDPATPATPGAKAGADIAAEVGVTAGGIQRDPKIGASAVVTSATGTLELRRVGEAAFAPAKQDDKLYSGDTLRTADGATATVALSDETIVQLSETSQLGIGTRAASADPATSAAVLSGIARFSVNARAPGEGAFRVYTPFGIVVATGTAFGVGVAASGEARVGVESGTVEVIGLGALDAQPVALDGGVAVIVAANGSVGTPAPWPADDWGTWRDGADAKVEAQVAIDAHAAALVELGNQLKDAYADLAASADTIAAFEVKAAASADKLDTAAYQAALPDGAATIEASFALGGRVEAMTWAYAGHAAIASDIYVRTPTVKFEAIAPRVDAAVLWPKRFEVTAVGYLEPLRTQYYVHHPRGRANAAYVGVVVPTFYAKVEPPEIDPPRIRSRVKAQIWIAPPVAYVESPRPVWIGPPSIEWHAHAHVAPMRARGNVAWYVRPPNLRAKVLVGVPATAQVRTRLVIGAPTPHAQIVAAWRVPVGARVRIAAPDLALATRARAKLVVRGPDVRAKVKVATPRADVNIRDHVGVVGGVKAKVNVRGPDVRAKVKVAAPAVKVKIKVPAPPPPPKIKVKAKVDVKAGFKVGN